MDNIGNDAYITRACTQTEYDVPHREGKIAAVLLGRLSHQEKENVLQYSFSLTEHIYCLPRPLLNQHYYVIWCIYFISDTKSGSKS